MLSASFDRSPSAAEDDSPGTPRPIERYTGPPIFLDEPETPPPAVAGREARRQRQISRTARSATSARSPATRTITSSPTASTASSTPTARSSPKASTRTATRTARGPSGTTTAKCSAPSTYKNGQPDGSWDVLNADGAVVAKRGYKDGKRDGTWVVYDETGKQPLREEVYTDGKANGTWKVWFPTGQAARREIGIKDGIRDGRYAEWDEKGNKRAELNFVAGKLDGTATLWGADGKKVDQQYDHGKLVKESQGRVACRAADVGPASGSVCGIAMAAGIRCALLRAA